MISNTETPRNPTTQAKAATRTSSRKPPQHNLLKISASIKDFCPPS